MNKKAEPIKVTVQEMYNQSQDNYDEFLAELDKSLSPRSPDVLYEKFSHFEPSLESVVLDGGCRNAAQACELFERFGCRVVGIDIVDANINEAQKRIAEKGIADSVQIVKGDIQQLPFPDESFDFIWCRDVLSHMPDLMQAFSAYERVLKRNGRILIFETFATDLMTHDELLNLCLPLASNPDNMSQTYFEDAFHAAGLSLVEADILNGEWREYGEEAGSNATSKQLLRIARMRRNRERLIAQFGEKDYACELANCHYGVYQMLGKMHAIIYTLGK